LLLRVMVLLTATWNPRHSLTCLLNFRSLIMAVQLQNVPALDPNAYTGPTRVMAGVARTGNVTLDTMYGASGTVEFARWLYRRSR
jgi:hypothetical protein